MSDGRDYLQGLQQMDVDKGGRGGGHGCAHGGGDNLCLFCLKFTMTLHYFFILLHQIYHTCQ